MADSPALASIPPKASGQPTAQDVTRGICRLFARNDIWCLSEMPLRNGRRADLMGIDPKGRIVIVEIKVSRADLLGDGKWPDYLDFCDRFFWGLPPRLDRGPLEGEDYRPDSCGIIVADGYDAEILRPAPPPARRCSPQGRGRTAGEGGAAPPHVRARSRLRTLGWWQLTKAVAPRTGAPCLRRRFIGSDPHRLGGRHRSARRPMQTGKAGSDRA